LEDPVGQGNSQDVCASSFDVPQKNVVEMPVPGDGVGTDVLLLHDVKGIQDSSEGQSFDEPDGHGCKHFSFASARSVPQKNVSLSDGGGPRPTQVVNSKQLKPTGQFELLPSGHGYSQDTDASSNEEPQ
jgi:hypothetical protein